MRCSNTHPLMAYCFIWSSVQPFDNILSEDEDLWCAEFVLCSNISRHCTLVLLVDCHLQSRVCCVLRAVCCLLVFSVFSLKPMPTYRLQGRHICVLTRHCRCCSVLRGNKRRPKVVGLHSSYFLLDHFQYWHKAPHYLILLSMWRQDCHKCLHHRKESKERWLSRAAPYFSH